MFDSLYEASKSGYKFRNLMDYISDRNNILLAYRTIKRNKGSMTPGTDGKTIKDIEKLSDENIIKLIQAKLENYKPKSVRRVEIPKIDGKTRPLGIPCIIDRIVQQCIKQVMEPICEAKFNTHSYGFRPNRSVEHALADAMRYMNFSNCHYVVDIDIKGFFDNVDHEKLKKQIWSMGIEDKNLICVIGKILKSEVEGIGIQTKGTPQGGIISPLLSNICLNELDWWLHSQWEGLKTRHSFSLDVRSGSSNKYRALRQTTNIKEFWFVRYADDFKIFCKDYKTAQKMYIAVKQWLKERLKLDISDAKSKVTNLRKNYTNFLGFKLKVKPKNKKFVCESHMSNKSMANTELKLKNQIKKIQRYTTIKEVMLLNSMILGSHQYYKSATKVSRDFNRIHFNLLRTIMSRLRKVLSSPREHSKAYKKSYGQYNGKPRAVLGISIFPIYGVVYEVIKSLPRETCNYTEKGRELIHKKVNSKVGKLLYNYLMYGSTYKSVELFDNSVSLLSGQKGQCGVTKIELKLGNMELHHKIPRSIGGTDEYKNLIWLCKSVHKLIHATTEETINVYKKELNLDNESLMKLNKLRQKVGNSSI